MNEKRKRNKDKRKDDWGRKEKVTRIRERMNEGEKKKEQGQEKGWIKKKRKRNKDKRKDEWGRKEKVKRTRERMYEEEKKKKQG